MENITKINVGGVDYEVRKDLAEKVIALEDKVFPLTIALIMDVLSDLTLSILLLSSKSFSSIVLIVLQH